MGIVLSKEEVVFIVNALLDYGRNYKEEDRSKEIGVKMIDYLKELEREENEA